VQWPAPVIVKLPALFAGQSATAPWGSGLGGTVQADDAGSCRARSLN